MRHLRISFLVALLLLLCCGTVAQQAPKTQQSQAKSNAAPSALTVDSQSAPPSILLPPSPGSEKLMPRPTTQVDVEVIHASASKELDTYVNTSVLPLIRANWYQVISKSKEKVGGDVTIEFTIAKDGGAQAIKLRDGTGHAALGDLAIHAISSSGKFGPLPVNLSSVDVIARFNYQPPPNAGVTGGAPGPGFIPSCNHEENVNCVTPPQLIVTPPQLIVSPPPEGVRPPSLISTKPSIKTTLQLIVTTEGQPSHIEVLKSLGAELDQKAIAAVQSWKFLPATKDGKPVPTQIVVEVEFHLDDDK